MNYIEFVDKMATLQLPPAVILWGEEEYFKHQAIQAVKGRYPWLRQGTVKLYTSGISPTQLTDELCTPPLFARQNPSKLLVLVDDSDSIQRYKDEIKKYLSAPDPQIIFFILTDKEVKGLQGAWHVECSKLKGQTLREWIWRQANARGKVISPKAMAQLGKLAEGVSMQCLAGWLEQIFLYLGQGRRRIEPSDLKIISQPSLEGTAFEITLRLQEGRVQEALQLLRTLLEKGETGPMIVGALAWQYRKLFGTRPRWLAQVHRIIMEADFQLKTSSESEEVILESLIFKLAGLGPARSYLSSAPDPSWLRSHI